MMGCGGVVIFRQTFSNRFVLWLAFAHYCWFSCQYALHPTKRFREWTDL